MVFTGGRTCPQCEIYKKALESANCELVDEYVDVYVYPEKTHGFNIMSLPVTVVLRNGHEVGRKNGAMTAKKLKEFIDGCNTQ